MQHHEAFSFNFLDILLVAVRWKRFLLINTAIISIIAIIVALLLPVSYTAKVVLMPPEGEQSDLMSLMKGIPAKGLLGAGGLGGGNLEDVYIAICNSRTMQMSIVDTFDLVSVYKFDKAQRYFIEDVLKALSKNVGVSADDDGTIVITASDESPERAKAMAEFMVRHLDRMYKALKVQTATNRRQFLERRLVIVRADLAAAEDSVVAFQQTHKVFDIGEQSRATAGIASSIEGENAAAELQLLLLKNQYVGETPATEELERRLSALRGQRKKLFSTSSSEFLVAPEKAPLLALQFLRLKRDAKVQEFLYEFLVQQYEEVKIEESRTVPVVQVLDAAAVPQKRTKPKRGMLVLMAFAASCLEGLAVMGLLEHFSAMRRDNTENYQKLMRVFAGLFRRRRVV